MSGTFFIPYGADIYELVDEYGLDTLCSTLVFECQCRCGGVYYVDFDGFYIANRAGTKSSHRSFDSISSNSKFPNKVVM